MPILKDEELIQNIKYCGQSLIDNAEKIVVGYKYRQGLTITCYVDEYDRAPYISVDTEFVPENFIDGYISKSTEKVSGTYCCSDTCEKKFECGRHSYNHTGLCYVEDYSSYGSGTFTDNGCEVEYWCGKLGDYKMYEPVKDKAVMY